MAVETTLSLWEQRFRAPVTFLPEWSPAAPSRVTYASNEPGIWQLHAWDLATDGRHRVTDHPVGVLDGTPTLDGEGILWFQDETGDESGQWLIQPFHGGEVRPFLDGVPHGWNDGLAQAPGIVAAAISNRDGFAVYVSLDGASARELHRASTSAQLGGSEDGGFLLGALSADSIRARAMSSATSRTRGCRCTRAAGLRWPAISGSRSRTSATATTGPGSGTC
jgi:hypothetical protein